MSRAYCITVNNWSEEGLVQLLSLFDSASYSIVGFETAPTTGTPHLQAYAYWKNKKAWNSVKKGAPAGAHIEIAKGTPQHNREYCSKSGEFEEFGECPRQGKRTDLQAFKDAILEGKPEEDLLEEHTIYMARYDRFYNRCKNIRLMEEAKKMEQPEVVVLIGEPGVGKTRYVYDNENIDDIYKIEVGDGSSGSVWWDGYGGEPVVLIDDFHNNLKLDYMLRLLDRYPMKLNIKGGYTIKCAKKIYITSNIEPAEWYPHCRDIHRRALMRRITEIKHLPEQ